LGVQWKNGNGQHERSKNEARHRPPLLLLVCRDQGDDMLPLR
jgi:hypothetical protein